MFWITVRILEIRVSFIASEFFHAGDETGSDLDEYIRWYRERFELIVRTDGEDSGGESGQSQRYSTSYPHPARRSGAFTVQSGPDLHDMDGKQQTRRSERVVSGVA